MIKVDKSKSDGNVNIILLENEKVIAKAKCYLVNTPLVDGKNIGTIGNIDIINKDYGRKLLSECEKIFIEEAIHTIVAPMNGNTWKQYRTLKMTNNEPTFLLENVDPIEYNEIIKDAGFRECNLYTSDKGKIDDAYYSEIIEKIKTNLKKANIVIRKFNKEKAIVDLTKIYNIATKSFKRNPFYTDIEKEEFVEQYMQYLTLIDSDLILIAEKDGEEIGFIFCIPNYNELKLYGKIKTLILKTVAVIPQYEHLAIGNVMLSDISKIAKEKGFEEWIFAFMHSTNTSQKMAKRNKAKVIREYALYRKEI